MRRHTIKQQRTSILLEIDRLDKQRCKHCINPQQANGGRCKCPAAKKVCRLGEELMSLTMTDKDGAASMLDKLKIEDLTIAEYKILKKAEFTDLDIRSVMKVGSVKFSRWKRDNGLLGDRGVGV